MVVLAPHDLWGSWAVPAPGEPDHGKLYRLLGARGFGVVRLDTTRSVLNPFRRAHPVLRAIDPWRALRVMLLHRGAAVVVCNFESSALVILLLRRLLRFRAKVAVWDVGVPGWRLRTRILQRVLPRADLLMPLGRSQVDGLVALGARSDRVRPVLTSADVDFYSDAGDAPDGYVLAVGDDASRDYATFLAATDRLGWPTVVRSRLVQPDPSRPELRIVSGPQPIDSYRRLIAGAAVIVIALHASVSAGGITVLLEAMASGKAIVVSASPGLADYVEDGVTCRVAPCGDAAALRDVIDALLIDPAERARLGGNARRACVGRFSREAAAKRLADELDRLLEHRPIEPNGSMD